MGLCNKTSAESTTDKPNFLQYCVESLYKILLAKIGFIATGRNFQNGKKTA